MVVMVVMMMMVVMSCRGGRLWRRSAGATCLGSYRSGVLSQLRRRSRCGLRARRGGLVGRLGAEGREEVGQERPVARHGRWVVAMVIRIRPSGGHIHTRHPVGLGFLQSRFSD